MSQIILDTATVTTDGYADLSLDSSGYTTATFTVKNPSASQGVYRIVTGSGDYTDLVARTPDVTLEPNETRSVVAVQLTPGVAYNFFLQRNEFDSWVKQGGVSTASTKSILDVGVSTSSRSAVVSWINNHTAVYVVRLYDQSNDSASAQLQQVTAQLNTSTNKYEAVMSGLSNTVNYTVSVQTVEDNMRTDTYFPEFQAIGSADFTPSAFANLNVGAVFASYMELSWDDGDVGDDEEDREAEFRIRQQHSKSLAWSTAMDWTPDTTKSFTVTGLIPGDQYQFQLNRRGVDGVSVMQPGSETFVTTKTTEITIGDIGSNTLGFNWTSVYAGATLEATLNPAKITTRTVSGTSVSLTNLIPDTNYTFELFVREEGQKVLLATSTQKTDKSAVLSLEQARYTNATFAIQSHATRDSTYYIANEDETIKSSSISLTAGTKKTVQLAGFDINSTNKIVLKRSESEWVTQGLDLVFSTKSVTVSTSVASTSSMVQWGQGYNEATYELSVFDAPPGPDTVPIEVYTNASLNNNADGVRSGIITDLDKETSYWGEITVAEANALGVVEDILIKSFNFETSAGAVFQVGEVKASVVHLSWDAGEVQEEDGVAEFKVKKQEVSVGTSNDATSWLPHDTTSFAKLTGLKAGTAYKFELVRLGLDGNEVTQATVDVETRTSTLTISGTASSRIEVEWTELYPGASYLLFFTIEGGSPEPFGDGPTSGTSALLEGLEASSNYTIELYGLEDSKRVGLATSALGSAATASTATSRVVVAGAAIAVVIVFGLVIYNIRTKRRT